MPVEGIKVSTLINKVQQSNLTWQEKTKLSLFIESAAGEDDDSSVLSNNELGELIDKIDFGFREFSGKIKNILGISSGKLPEVTEEDEQKPVVESEPQNAEPKLQNNESEPQKNNIDKSKPGVKWQTIETRGFGGNVTKTVSTWERQEDGTSVKYEVGIINTNKGFKSVMLKSHYQADDKTPIQIQTSGRFGGMNLVAEENYDNNGNLKNRTFKLDDYNKYKSIDIPSLEFALPKIMQRAKCKSTVVKDSSGKEKIRFQNGNYSVDGQNITPKKAEKILESISEKSGFTYTEEF